MDLKGQTASENGVGATTSQEAQLHERRPVAFVLARLQNLENSARRQAEDLKSADIESSATMSAAPDFAENVFLGQGVSKVFEDESSIVKNRDEFDEVILLVKYYAAKYFCRNNRIQKILMAAQENDVESINSFIQSGYGLDCEDSSGATPLLTAVMHENYGVARILRRAHISVLVKELLGANPPPLSFYEYHKHQLEIKHTNIFVQKMIEKTFSAVRIGKILAEIHCNLYEVVQFRNSIMTKAYLLSCTNENVDLTTVIPVDMFDFDVRHIQVLISCGPKSRKRKREFMYILLMNICDYQKSEAGRNFLKKLSCREIVDEDFLEVLEELLQIFPKRCIKIILKYGFNLVAKEKYGRDVTGILFANPHRKVLSLLDNGKIDVDRRYNEGNTPLHIAAKYYAADNIQLLLDKGADPNAFNDNRDTPLALALKNEGDGIPDSEKSIKLLLFGGANPMTVSKQFENTFFRFDQSTITSDYGVDVSKLLIAQLAINEAVGLSVEQPITILKSFHGEELKGFLQECRRQLKDFIAHEICDTRDKDICTLKFTILTILADRPENLARYISKEQLRLISQLMTTHYKKTSCLFYLELFKQRVKDIIEISSYRNRATQVICDFVGIHNSNHLVVRKIINYFTVKDLVIFKEKWKHIEFTNAATNASTYS